MSNEETFKFFYRIPNQQFNAYFETPDSDVHPLAKELPPLTEADRGLPPEPIEAKSGTR